MSADLADEPCAVVAIHTVVPGRLRVRIDGLHRNEALQHWLETRLSREPGITSASASYWTGNALVLHDPEVAPASVVERICAAVARAPTPRSDVHVPVSAGGRRAGERSFAGAETQPIALPWHCIPAEQTAAEFASDRERGLGEAEVERRLARDGANTVPTSGGRSEIAILLDQVATLPVALLGASAVLSLATGGALDALVILGVVALNAVIGYATESRAEQTIAELRTLTLPTAHAIRGGQVQEVAAAGIVRGDILVLNPGTFIAADARVIRARNLLVNESVLTGESLPGAKTAEVLPRPDLALADRSNMVYRSTAVTGGSGLAVVVATGVDTEAGHIQALIDTLERPATPLERQLAVMGHQLVWLCLGVCALVLGIGLVRGFAPLSMLKTAISLAVAALPEGLPAIATTAMAVGVTAMQRRRVLIRRLEAVETLGAVETLCFDKTGTLTLNRMSVVAVIGPRGRIAVGTGAHSNGERADIATDPDLRRVVELAALCNETAVDAKAGRATLNGSATEAALVELALESGIDVGALRARHPMLAVDHRTDGRPLMRTIHGSGDAAPRLIAVKGSPTAVLAMCDRRLTQGAAESITQRSRRVISGHNATLAGEGLRVLGIAYAEVPAEALPPDGLVWAGLLGLSDPVRPGMRELMRVFRGCGIRTVMITGDQGATAQAIARRVDLTDGEEVELVEASEIEALTEDTLAARAVRAHVFARVSPTHKLRIVRSLQRAGQVVAMTGDGVNDGPALKAADIGVAMGQSGTEAARDVADIVLAEDDLHAMVDAVAQSRTTYDNIRKSIRYLLATNLSEVAVTLGATASGMGTLFAPIQLLWINLISDVLPAIALALEPPAPDVLARPPRDPREPLIRPGDFYRLGREAAVMSGAAVTAHAYGLLRHGPSPRTGTVTFASLIAAQLLHARTARSETRGLVNQRQLPANPFLTGALALSFGVQVLAMLVPPLRGLLGLAPVDLVDGAVVMATALASFLTNEGLKPRHSKVTIALSTAATDVRLITPPERAPPVAFSRTSGGSTS